MSDLEIPAEAVQIVAAHCFGRPQTDGSVYYPDGEGAAHDVAVAALDDAAPLIVAAELRRMAALYERKADAVMLHRDGRGTERRVAFLGSADMASARADDLDLLGGVR